MNFNVLCMGEVLWDALPAGLFPGGACFNVAAHLRQLGVEASFASRVGDDELGREIRRRMRRGGLDDALLQTDPELPTGFVVVDLSDAQAPRYEILRPSAWDAIETPPALREAAGRADAFVFGSLAQRDERSRAAIQELARGARRAIFDVNLRPPFDDRAIVEASLELATVVKLNDDELARLGGWFGLTGDEEASARELADRFGLTHVCLTRGARGAAAWDSWAWTEHAGCPVEVADSVGAGDAFLAAWLEGLLAERSMPETLAFANAVGAYVAGRHGATPPLDIAAIRAQC